MSQNETSLRDAAAMVLGRDKAKQLIRAVKDETVKQFKLSTPIVELGLAAANAANVMQRMRQGTFRGATTRIREALQKFDELP